MFSGFTSRCTTPCECTWASAFAMSSAMRTASDTGKATLATQPLAHRLAVDERHREIQDTLGLAGVA